MHGTQKHSTARARTIFFALLLAYNIQNIHLLIGHKASLSSKADFDLFVVGAVSGQKIKKQKGKTLFLLGRDYAALQEIQNDGEHQPEGRNDAVRRQRGLPDGRRHFGS